MVRIVFGMDELLLTLGFLLQALCVIWIIFYIRNKRESEREVALADELIEEENDIIVTGHTIVTDSTIVQTIGRPNHNRTYFIPLREEKEDFIPKKKMKYHTLEEPIARLNQDVGLDGWDNPEEAISFQDYLMHTRR